MITLQIPRLPSLPAGNDEPGPLFEGELHRAVAEAHYVAARRAKWLDSFKDIDVTSTPSRRRHTALARGSGSHSGLSWPWKFNVSLDGNQWWPSPSRAIAAEAGQIGSLFQPVADGQAFDSLGPENPLPLSPGARTFWVKVPLLATEDGEYSPGDTFRPAIPGGDIEIVNLAVASTPAETTTTVFIPWVDIPPAAPPAARNPTYHFSLWFRASHYWHFVAEEPGLSQSISRSSSSDSSSSQSSSDRSSGSSSSKSIVL